MAEGYPMPEFTVKEVRLPELHLPEIKRDEIVRSLSGVRLPEVDLARARRATIKVPAVSVSSSDVGRLLAAAAALARFVRPAPSRPPMIAIPFGRRSRSSLARIVGPRRRGSRWPLAIGVVVVILGAWAILRRPEVRRRVQGTARNIRTRFDELRAGMDAREPVALTESEATTDPIEGTPTTDPSGSRAVEETSTTPA
jgi:hypothetical protein